MNINTISVIAGSRAISQSDLARMAGISRQAVSRWFKQGGPEIEVRASHLQKLSQALGVSTRLQGVAAGVDRWHAHRRSIARRLSRSAG